MALAEFTSGGARDFRQRYQGVYGYFPLENGKKILVYLSSVHDRETKFIDGSGIEYTAKADQGVFFQFIPIEKRLFVFENLLYLAERRPARQYSRGISDQNTCFAEVAYRDFTNVTFASIEAYANPVYDTEIDLLKSVQLLSPMFGIRHSSIYLYNRVIGSVRYGKTPVLAVSDKMFFQELEDVVRERGIKAEVVRAL